MNVPGEPLLSPRLLAASLLPSGRDVRRALPYGDLRLYRLGRDAMADAVSGLAPGPVLVPALICREALEGLQTEGREVRFYQLGSNFNPDWRSLDTTAASGAAALVLVHYFGFPASAATARSWCDARGISLIEDCAHSFLSWSAEGPAGAVGDYAVFSFRKQLPVASGAALRVNTPAGSANGRRAAPTRGSAGLLPALREVASWTVLSSKSPWLRRLLAPAVSDERGLHAAPQGRARRMDLLAARIIARLSPGFGEVAEKRRANYRAIDNALRGLPAFTPLFDRLRDGAVPWGYPTRVRRGVSARDTLLSVLLGDGIGAWAWPDLPAEVTPVLYPLEARLAEETIVLPVHQCLSSAQVQHVADTVAAWAIT